MTKKWIIAAMALGLLLTGCGKKEAEDTTPLFEAPIPVLTEAPTWPSLETTEDADPADPDAPAEETEAPVETEAPETTPPETAPKEDPNVEPVNETVWVKAHVNVRDAAGFNSKVLGTLEGGDTIIRTGIGKHGWSRVTYDGRTAYIANNYLSTDSPEKAGGATYQEVNQTVKATAKVNIRRGPGVDYQILGSLKAGEEVQRTGIGSKGWSRIQYDGKTCYVSSNYLRVVSNDAVPDDK